MVVAVVLGFRGDLVAVCGRVVELYLERASPALDFSRPDRSIAGLTKVYPLGRLLDFLSTGRS